MGIFLPILICNKVGLQVYTVYGMFYEILFFPLLLPDWRDPFSLNSVDKVQKDWLEVKYMTLSYFESFFWLDIAYFFPLFLTLSRTCGPKIPTLLTENHQK